MSNTIHAVSMPRGTSTQTRDFVYDSTTQRLTSATNPENGTVSYTYNADGTLATKLDANGNTESYSYDTYGRLTGIPDRQQTFSYDTCPANDSFCVNSPGHLVEATFGSGIGPNQLSFRYNYTYTPAGKVASKKLTLQSANHLSMWQVPAYGSPVVTYSYDNQGALTSMVYPTCTWGVCSSPTFTYTLDAMERPTGLTDSDNNVWASGVTYTPAGQTTFGGRIYNNLQQLTQVGTMTYNYSATQNNSQITSSVDALSGETITYTYDALKRLATAGGLNWGETYSYDGFGNMIQMQPSGTAGAPAMSVTVDPATNRIWPTGVAYDNNGNMTQGFGLYFGYDAANRLTTTGNATYAYDSDNRRIYFRDSSGNEKIYFYGADGKKLTTYTYTITTFYGDPEIQLVPQSKNVYFAGILVSAEGQTVQTDRLGSVRTTPSTTHRYYPYGTEYTTTTNETEKYATYTRDSLTGLDYAVNRYYSSTWGRFLGPDRSSRSANRANPLSWNRYTYTLGDPVNGTDPQGLDTCTGEGCGDGNGNACASGATWCTTDTEPTPQDPSGTENDDAPDPLDPAPVRSVPQQPICELTVESRPLDYFWIRNGPDLHGFLEFDGPLGSQIIEGLHKGNRLTATVDGVPAEGTFDGSIKGAGVCHAITILEHAVTRINAANIPYVPAGPNSSSALRYMLQSLNPLTGGVLWYNIPTFMQIFGYYALLPGLETFPSNPYPPRRPIFHR